LAHAGRREQQRWRSSSIAEHLVGLISDTHGLLRPDVHDALTGVDLILHAGDVGGHDILDELALIAPVMAVFGNTDPADDTRLSAHIRRTLGGVSIHVSHGHELGAPTARRLLERYPEQILVFGHTHRAEVVRADGRLVVNPGAAGPRRFHLVPSVGKLRISDDGTFDVEIIPLGA
jgi:putative phosphoesterase